jgi:hypothetical protein
MNLIIVHSTFDMYPFPFMDNEKWTIDIGQCISPRPVPQAPHPISQVIIWRHLLIKQFERTTFAM